MKNFFFLTLVYLILFDSEIRMEGIAQELLLPKPTELPVGSLVPPSSMDQSKDKMQSLEDLLQQIKTARQKLQEEREGTEKKTDVQQESSYLEKMKLRLRLAELLTKLAAQTLKDKSLQSQAKNDKEEPPAKGVQKPPEPASKLVSKSESIALKITDPSVVEPFSLAHALFRLEKYEEALTAYQSIDLIGLKVENSAPIRYMIATCFRKMGRLEEAKVKYREIANLKGDSILAHCAQWQLSTLHWEEEIKSQVNSLQQRLKELEKKP